MWRSFSHLFASLSILLHRGRGSEPVQIDEGKKLNIAKYISLVMMRETFLLKEFRMDL
jgi:hypothetical protein